MAVHAQGGRGFSLMQACLCLDASVGHEVEVQAVFFGLRQPFNFLPEAAVQGWEKGVAVDLGPDLGGDDFVGDVQCMAKHLFATYDAHLVGCCAYTSSYCGVQ